MSETRADIVPLDASKRKGLQALARTGHKNSPGASVEAASALTRPVLKPNAWRALKPCWHWSAFTQWSCGEPCSGAKTQVSRAEPIRLMTVEREGEDGLLVTFSDGTTTGYVTEELLELRPFREPSLGATSASSISSV